jgi:hypothetical protein
MDRDCFVIDFSPFEEEARQVNRASDYLVFFLGGEDLAGLCSVSVVFGWALTYSLVTNLPLSEFLRTILVPPLAIEILRG